jgi:hypothetical protein
VGRRKNFVLESDFNFTVFGGHETSKNFLIFLIPNMTYSKKKFISEAPFFMFFDTKCELGKKPFKI